MQLQSFFSVLQMVGSLFIGMLIDKIGSRGTTSPLLLHVLLTVKVQQTHICTLDLSPHRVPSDCLQTVILNVYQQVASFCASVPPLSRMDS